MKLITTFITTLFTSLVLSNPVVEQKRTLADYINIVNDIDDQVLLVTTTVNEYVAGVVPVSVPLQESSELVDLVTSSVDAYSVLAPLTTLDALALYAALGDLCEDLNDMVFAYIMAKPNFDAEGVSYIILEILVELAEVFPECEAQLYTKIPPALIPAVDLMGPCTVHLQVGIDAFS